MMTLKDLPDEPNKSLEDMKVLLLLNLTAVKLKEHKYKEALTLSNEASRRIPKLKQYADFFISASCVKFF